MQARLVALVMAVLVAGCAVPTGGEVGAEEDTTKSPSTAGLERPPDDHFANTLTNSDEPDGPPIEQAFAGRVVAVDDDGPVPWVTFAIDRWFTDDLGYSIGLWAPEFDGAVDTDWLIAATRYQSGDRPIGDVLVDESAPGDDETFAAWEQEWGGSVAPGLDVAESTPAPDVLADLAAARARWATHEPADWTATIDWRERGTVYGECGSGPVRVVVEDGTVTEAVDLQADCDVDDPLSITDLFDRAEEIAGALEEPPIFDDTYGFPTALSAWDRSIEVGLRVTDFAPEAQPLARGAPDEALADARALWEAADIVDYTMVVEPRCFCGFQGEVEVVVVNGEQVDVRPRDPDVTAEQYDGLDLTVDGIFRAVSDAIASGTVDVAYDPDRGYPTSAALDPMPNAVDDEITYRVLTLKPATTG